MSDCDKLGDCQDSRLVRIYEYLDGEMTCGELDEVKAHLDSCPDCASEHDIEYVIRSVVKRSCDEHAPSSLKDRIMQRLASHEAGATASR